MIKLSNAVLVNSQQSLSTLSQQSLPIKISYLISKNIVKISDELKIYNEERQKLINKYGKKDENDKLIVDKNNQVTFGENTASWNKDFSELLSIENEVDIKTFSIDKLDNVTLSPNELMQISYMIEEPKEDYKEVIKK